MFKGYALQSPVDVINSSQVGFRWSDVVEIGEDCWIDIFTSNFTQQLWDQMRPLSAGIAAYTLGSTQE